MSARLTLSEELTDRLQAQADVVGHATVESLLTSLLDRIEPANAAAARRLRRERTAERDRVLAEAAAAGWEDWPEIEDPDRPGRAGAASDRRHRPHGPDADGPAGAAPDAGRELADALAAA